MRQKSSALCLAPRLSCLLPVLLASLPAVFAAAPLQAGGNTVEIVTGYHFAPGEAANGASSQIRLRGNGRYLAFTTRANNLEAGVIDSNQADDVYVLDRVGGLYDLVSRSAAAPARTDGTAGARSESAGLSEDGRFVLFGSRSEALIAGGTYPATGPTADYQAFLFDRGDRAMQLVSHAPGMPAVAADSSVTGMLLSADGRFAAYTSAATNLAAGGAGNTVTQVYLFDRATGESSLISHAAGAPGTFGNAASSVRGLSADGRYLLIGSSATNLVAGLSYAANPNLYLYDRQDGSLRLLTRAAGSPATAVGGSALDFTRDGRFVLLATPGVEMQAGLTDGNGAASDVFVYDRQTDAAQLVSHAAAPVTTGGNAASAGGRISDDGRFSYFESKAGNLVAGFTDNNGGNDSDVFVHDSQSGTVTLVSHAAGSAASSGNGWTVLTFGSAVSPDGRYALLVGNATDLQAGVADSNGTADVYLYDRVAGSSTLASRLGGLVAGSGNFYSSGAALDDGTALFGSEAALDGSQPDRNFANDLYFYDSSSGSVDLVTVTPLAGKTAQYQEAPLVAEVHLEKSGRWVTWGPYILDARTGTIERVAHAAGSPSTPPNAFIYTGPASSDGRFVAFSTGAGNLLSGGGSPSSVRQVYFYDRNVDTAFRVTRRHNQPAQPCNGDSVVPFMSPEARFFVIESTCDQLMPNLTGGGPGEDVFFYDRSLGVFELISHGFASALEMGDQASLFSQAAADFSWLVYTSGAHNQVAGFVDHNDVPLPDLQEDPNGVAHLHDLYYYDRATGAARLVTRRPGTPNDGSEGTPELVRATADGSSVFYTSEADDLVAGQTPRPLQPKIYRWNRATGASELVVAQPGNPLAPCTGSTALADITPDGRYVLFSSTCQLAAGDLNGVQDAYLLDRTAGQIHLISHLPGLPQTSDGLGATARAISPDGRRIFFRWAGVAHVYDRRTGIATALGVAYYDEAEQVPSDVAIPYRRPAAVSADGARVLLRSDDARLAPFDANQLADHFLATVGDLFSDGFESGSTDAWSQALP